MQLCLSNIGRSQKLIEQLHFLGIFESTNAVSQDARKVAKTFKKAQDKTHK